MTPRENRDSHPAASLRWNQEIHRDGVGFELAQPQGQLDHVGILFAHADDPAQQISRAGPAKGKGIEPLAVAVGRADRGIKPLARVEVVVHPVHSAGFQLRRLLPLNKPTETQISDSRRPSPAARAGRSCSSSRSLGERPEILERGPAGRQAQGEDLLHRDLRPRAWASGGAGDDCPGRAADGVAPQGAEDLRFRGPAQRRSRRRG